MKLAVVVDTFPRWSERFLARECQALRHHGADLSIFCLRAGDELPAGEHEWDGLIQRRIVLPRCLVPSLRSEKHLPKDVRERRDLVRKTVGATAYAKVRCAESFIDLLRADRYTHVHAHFANLPSTIGWLAAMESGLPLTLSVHARDLFVEAQLLSEKAADAKAVFCCNSKAEAFLKQAVPANTVIHMSHGLPPDFFQRERQSASSDVPHFLAAGRFVEKKGFADFIDALATPEVLAKKWTATLLGEGPLKSKLAAKIQRLKLGARVKIKDPVFGEALRAEFEKATAFVAPYKETADGDSDGVPNVVLEAMALGVPVIARGAALLGDSRVLKAQGTDAPAALASALGTALDSPTTLKRIASDAKTWVAQEYDSARNIAPLLKVLSS
jgi:glycosyltransferase involved in cell wall biosynthesis